MIFLHNHWQAFESYKKITVAKVLYFFIAGLSVTDAAIF